MAYRERIDEEMMAAIRQWAKCHFDCCTITLVGRVLRPVDLLVLLEENADDCMLFFMLFREYAKKDDADPLLVFTPSSHIS